MRYKAIKISKKTHPTGYYCTAPTYYVQLCSIDGIIIYSGDPNFSVMQAFPAGISAEDADPFLMCDHFGPKISTGPVADPDKYPVGWHPHRGMDLVTYLIKGTNHIVK